MTSRVKVKFPKAEKERTQYAVYRETGSDKLIFPLQNGSGAVFILFADGSFGVHSEGWNERGPEVKLNIEAEEV